MKKRIFNFQFSIFNSESGYTLVELLAVIAIVVVVGVIVTGILISSLRGGSKSNVLDNVRQNGNDAITQMSKMIIYAQSFNGASTDGAFYTTNCTQVIPPSPSPTPSSINYKYIKITSFDGGTTIFSCNGSTDNPPNTLASKSGSLASFSLIDTSTVSLVSCYFSCTQTNFGQAPTIGINFTLSQNTSSGFAEKQATIPFQTSLTVRNRNL
ncbi:MAG: prepilin-type N-terminal cleavage/methylation domain-containing protein [Patescibacteria group bacterium]|nr:prepilin-type N-terminal cleavage/methylation domain-containing protein [Patescibacteria group bacterium]